MTGDPATLLGLISDLYGQLTAEGQRRQAAEAQAAQLGAENESLRAALQSSAGTTEEGS